MQRGIESHYRGMAASQGEDGVVQSFVGRLPQGSPGPVTSRMQRIGDLESRAQARVG